MGEGVASNPDAQLFLVTLLLSSGSVLLQCSRPSTCQGPRAAGETDSSSQMKGVLHTT